MSCGCSGNYEAKTVGHKKGRKKSRKPRTGPKVMVEIKGKRFMAHKRVGDPAKVAEMRRKNPKLYARAQAARQVAAAMKANGQAVRITDPNYQRMVSQRAAEILRGL